MWGLELALCIAMLEHATFQNDQVKEPALDNNEDLDRQACRFRDQNLCNK